MAEVIQHLSKFNPKNSKHKKIRGNNNAIMLHKIHKYLKSRTDLEFSVDKKEFAYWMTALGMNESASFTKESGINNFFGIVATKKQQDDTKRLTGREREFDFPPAKLVGTHEIGEVEGQGTAGKKNNQKRYFTNYKTEKEGMDAFFQDVILPNFPNVMKAKNSTEFVLALMKGKDNKMYATDFKFRENMPPQSALAPVLEDTGELVKKDKKGVIKKVEFTEQNIFSNQYWIKFHNFLGGVTRPDMKNTKEKLIVRSEKGKRGITHSPIGIKGGQYINTELLEKLENPPTDGGPVGTDARSMDLDTMLPDGMLDQSMRKIYDKNDLINNNVDRNNPEFDKNMDLVRLDESNSEYRIKEGLEDRGISQSDIMGGSTGAMDTTPDPLDVATDSLITGK